LEWLSIKDLLVGVPRIGLGSLAPKASILPLYYTPPSSLWDFGGQARLVANKIRFT
jgi:hypothetical protein